MALQIQMKNECGWSFSEHQDKAVLHSVLLQAGGGLWSRSHAHCGDSGPSTLSQDLLPLPLSHPVSGLMGSFKHPSLAMRNQGEIWILTDNFDEKQDSSLVG